MEVKEGPQVVWESFNLLTSSSLWEMPSLLTDPFNFGFPLNFIDTFSLYIAFSTLPNSPDLILARLREWKWVYQSNLNMSYNIINYYTTLHARINWLACWTRDTVQLPSPQQPRDGLQGCCCGYGPILHARVGCLLYCWSWLYWRRPPLQTDFSWEIVLFGARE